MTGFDTGFDTGSGGGLVIVDKPSGLTSHDVVARLRKLANTKKVGHAGTLDPMATGVLVCGLGGATRLLGRITRTDKEYEATIRLGWSTTTDDAQGTLVDRVAADWPIDELARDQTRLLAVLADFKGAISQRPSSVSAIKVAGRRGYERVRAGEDVVLAQRPVTVGELTLKSVSGSRVDDISVLDMDVVVSCSSGTYVRALARDIGESLGTYGHLSSLRRTRVGPFTLDQSATLDQLAGRFSIIPLQAVCRQLFASHNLSDADAKIIQHGGRLPWPDELARDQSVALFDGTNALLALAECKDDRLAPVVVWSPA